MAAPFGSVSNENVEKTAGKYISSAHLSLECRLLMLIPNTFYLNRRYLQDDA